MPVLTPFSSKNSRNCVGSNGSGDGGGGANRAANGRGERFRRCRCRYDWYGWLMEDDLNLMVKEGFRITPRFLGKSHCCRQGNFAADLKNRGDDSGSGGDWEDGFGCVLCASSSTSIGGVQACPDVNALRDHINSTHTKWEMQYDPDMAGHLGAVVIP